MLLLRGLSSEPVLINKENGCHTEVTSSVQQPIPVENTVVYPSLDQSQQSTVGPPGDVIAQMTEQNYD